MNNYCLMFLDDFSPIFDLMDELDGVIKDAYESELGQAILAQANDLIDEGIGAAGDLIDQGFEAATEAIEGGPVQSEA